MMIFDDDDVFRLLVSSFNLVVSLAILKDANFVKKRLSNNY